MFWACWTRVGAFALADVLVVVVLLTADSMRLVTFTPADAIVIVFSFGAFEDVTTDTAAGLFIKDLR